MKLDKWRLIMSTYEQYLRSNKETRAALSGAIMGAFWVGVVFFVYWVLTR